MTRSESYFLGQIAPACDDPSAAQWKLLSEILRRNAETVFGAQHGFGQIGSLAEYRSAVPVQSYDDLEPLILAQLETGTAALTSEQPVFYARTSGTTAAAKLLPITPTGRQQMVDAQKLAMACLAQTGALD